MRGDVPRRILLRRTEDSSSALFIPTFRRCPRGSRRRRHVGTLIRPRFTIRATISAYMSSTGTKSTMLKTLGDRSWALDLGISLRGTKEGSR